MHGQSAEQMELAGGRDERGCSEIARAIDNLNSF